MNYGRGFPLPHYRNTDSWNPANGIPIPPDDGIGQTRGSWTAAMLGGPIPGSGDLCETPITTIPVNNGVRGKGSESWMPTQVGNGIMGHRDSWTEIHQENGIAQNMRNWNPVIPNGNSWTPVTPVKPTNLVTVNKPTNQLENENWGDLVGMYKDLLREEPINLNEVAQEVYPIDGNQNQNRCVRRNLNPILNSTPVPNLTPIPKPNRDSNPISYFTSEDPANWDGNLLSAIMRPKRSVESVPFLNRPQNNDVHDLNRIPVSDSSTQIQRNIIGPNRVNSVLENQQSHTFTLNNIVGGYNSKKLPTDRFPVPYRPCYNLNSPPRSEPDATSSGITGPLPFAPITPDTGRKQTETQWVPAKNTQESQSQSQRKEITDNHENDQLHNIVESTSSAVSTTQKDNLVCEEGDEMGIDLNKTPNQKTPARRKKHRPKVIREKKPKKTRTPKDPNETPVKRKYVRKKVVDVSESPKENGIEVSPSPSPNGARVKRKYVRKKGIKKSGVDEDKGSKVKTPVKSCKKQLNFDLECVRDESQTREESQMREGINLNVNPQDIEHEKRVNSVLERSGIKVAENNVNGLGSPMGKTRDHALNILARNLSMRNGYKNQVGQSQSQSEMVNFDEQRGIKRQFFEQVNPRNLNAMDSLVMYQKLLLGGTARVDRGQDLASVLLESHKRTKTHNGVSALEDNSRTYRNVPAMQLLNSCSQRVNPNYQMMNGGGGNVTGHFRPPISAITQNLQKHPEPSGILQRQIQGNRANNMTAMVSWNRPPATPPKEYVRSGVITYPGPLLDKKRTPTPNSSNQKSNLEVHQKPTKPRGAPRKQKVAVAVSVEDITCMLERLCIYNENEKMRNALVPYKGSNVIVPFEPIKKRKPRPKVDLDPESDRLWRLLMGPEGSAANENMDKDKEKWWENERRVFRGRADSFIARMHLVQGDRRFSRWKGSVVDSVIGVFLTQNVSDHLSSSAFMSLAAKFSVKSTNTNETRSQNRTCVVVEEPIDTILPNDNVKCQQKIGRQPVFNQTSIVSQDSLDSSTIQTVDEIRSSSGSNSEAEDQTNDGPTNSIQPEKVNMFNELFSRETTTTPLDRSQYVHEIPKTPPSGSPGFGVLGESVSSLPSGNHTSNVTYQNEANSKEQNYSSKKRVNTASTKISRERKAAIEDEKKKTFDWDSLRRDVFLKCEKKERSNDAKDSLDYEALRNAHVNQISDAIRERGMNNLLADRIKDFLDRLVRDHGSIDLEWLRDVPPDKAKDYLLSIRGLGLKSVECVRLLTLHHLAFPVDTNVGRIAVRLGWVPLQPLPESLQLHLLEMYPVLESIQKYLWPRLCKLDQLTLYELHYQMITFGKVFCTKSKPNCNACPMRAECRHFASAFASARLALPGPEEKKLVPSVPNAPNTNNPIPPFFTNHMSLPPSENNNNNNNNNSNTDTQFPGRNCEPIIEEPTTPEAEPAELSLSDIEDQYYEDDDEIPTIKLDMNEFTMNLQKMQESMDIQGDMSQALVALNPQAASIPTPKLKNVSRLRTEHQVYELPDSHPILEGLDRREPDDPSPYLLAIWTPGETANSMQPPERGCQGQETGILCDKKTCFSCNCIKEANSQVVRGTILMPCRTATRGSFPLNGTYFQVNEMFADHSSSLKPIEVPRAWIWNLPRRTVYFGTSVSTIFKGLTTQEIQQCFWRGFVCVRGFDQKSRSPRPLMARLHFPASKLVNNKKNEDK